MAFSFLPGIVDPIHGADVWPPTIEYRRGADSVAAHLAALREVASGPGARPSRKGGRGVVTVGGGRYWSGIVVGIHLLRETGCTLPVEVWHRGELEPVCAADVRGLGDVRLIDASAMSRDRGDNRLDFQSPERGGWENKLYALTHTDLAQVLFLDADAYCVDDPATLFTALDPHAPFVFWHDLPSCEHTISWPRVWPSGPRQVPTVQGGQLLIDTQYAWPLLVVAHWMCQHSDYYFAHVYGDQDCWRVGLAATGGGYQCFGAADWIAPAFVCEFRGRPSVVHRCQSKLFVDAPPRPASHLPSESRVFKLFSESLPK